MCGNSPVKRSMSCSIVTLLPFLIDALLNWLGCMGNGVGVVGRAKLRAVNVEGKPLAGVAMAGDSVGEWEME